MTGSSSGLSSKWQGAGDAMSDCSGYTDDLDRAELRRIDIFQRRDRIRVLQGYYLDPANERPDCDEDEPGQYVEL
jgi:hypothetical protein